MRLYHLLWIIERQERGGESQIKIQGGLTPKPVLLPLHHLDSHMQYLPET